MQTKHQYITKASFSGLEVILFFLILLGAVDQVVFGESHMLFLLLRLLYAPGMVFLAGLYVSQGSVNNRLLLKRSAVYAVLFVIVGLCNQTLLNHQNPFQSFIRLITMQRIPTPSEMFFTASILFLCSAPAAKRLEALCQKRHLLSIAGVLAIFSAFFPSNIFRYPLIGVFIGCSIYDCVALLPYFGYFIAGIFIGKCSETFSKKVFIASILLTSASAALMFTPLRPAALITAASLPVYVLYLFSVYCDPYRNLAERLPVFTEKIFSVLKNRYQDFMANKPKTQPLYFIIYTIMFFITAACVFFPFIEHDNSIVWMHDAISYYIPRIHYFINYVHECIAQLLKGDFNFPSYSFRIGLGNTVPLSYEPVYWLFALFDSSHVEAAYNIITLLRFFLAGLSASILFLYYKRGYFESLLGSLMYTFCGFAIFAGVRHAHFIAPMIFLPLLIIATEEIFRKKRWYLCTVLVAAALLTNYYFIYMSTIAMGIYYIGRFLFTMDKGKKSWKYFFTTTATFAGSYLLGVVIGNISLFTSFASFVSSGRRGDSKIAAVSLFSYGNAWPVRFYTYFMSAPESPGAWLKLGFIPLSYIAIVILLAKKGNKFLKFLFLVAVSFCIFPVAAFVLGGFSTITNRWCYIFALLVSFITVMVIPELKRLTRKELKILLITLLPYTLIVLMNRDYRREYTLAALAILLCNYVIVLCMNKELHLISIDTAKAALIALCCGSLTLNAYFQYSIGALASEKYFSKQGQVIDHITDTPMKVLDHYPDDSFYRVSTTDIPWKNICSSLVMDYNSIATFSSTISAPVMDYNIQMGNTAWDLIQLRGFDNRTFMNALACVKYYAVEDDDLSRLPYGYGEVLSSEDSKKSYSVYQNNYSLPLGYTYDSVIGENKLENYSPLERQELMLQTAVLGNSSDTLPLSEQSPVSTVKEIEITDYTTENLKIKGNIVEVTEPDASLTLNFDGIENAETYLVFDGFLNPLENKSQCTVNIELTCDDFRDKLAFHSLNHTYSTGQKSYLFNLGYRKDTADSCTITFDKTGTFTVDSLKIYCQPMDNYASYIEKLTENKLENIEMSSDTITGHISVDKNKLLALSIPYQKGWTAYVDGQKTDIQKVNLMYSGLFLEPGEHDIKLVFRRPGIKASLCLSAAGIIVFIAALIVRRRRFKNENIKKIGSTK